MSLATINILKAVGCNHWTETSLSRNPFKLGIYGSKMNTRRSFIIIAFDAEVTANAIIRRETLYQKIIRDS